MLQAEVTKPLQEYIERIKAMVEEWVALCTIFEVCSNDMVYEVGERLRNQWCRQMSAERHLKTTLREILAAAWERRRRESGRHGGGEGR